MPELPEVEAIASGLRPRLVGLAIGGLKVFTPSLVRKEKSFRLETIRNRKVKDVRRRGKMLIIECQDGLFLIFHFKMTGRLVWADRGEPGDKHTHLALSFRGRPRELHYRDVRKFGFLRCLESSNPMECDELRRLGPEPLDLDRSAFARLFQGRRGRLKSLLLDQAFLAGIGNIYADEMLFEAGLHPLTPAASVTRRELDRLWTAMRSVLRRAIAVGGSSIRDFKDAEGVDGLFQREHRVYGRRSQPCRRCGTPIESQKIGGRTSSFCPRCQKRNRKPPN